MFSYGGSYSHNNSKNELSDLSIWKKDNSKPLFPPMGGGVSSGYSNGNSYSQGEGGVHHNRVRVKQQLRSESQGVRENRAGFRKTWANTFSTPNQPESNAKNVYKQNQIGKDSFRTSASAAPAVYAYATVRKPQLNPKLRKDNAATLPTNNRFNYAPANSNKLDSRFVIGQK